MKNIKNNNNKNHTRRNYIYIDQNKWFIYRFALKRKKQKASPHLLTVFKGISVITDTTFFQNTFNVAHIRHTSFACYLKIKPYVTA